MCSYVQENDWFITASKLKCFLKNPQEYYLKYVQKLELETEEARCLVVWTAFDDLVSYWEEFFFKKYYVDDWSVKEELCQKAIDKWEIDPKIIKAWKLPQLRAYMFASADWTEKIRLTPAEWRDIMWMFRESLRQPIADSAWDYSKQHTIKAKYKTLILKGKLDRFSLEKKLIRDWKTSWRIDNFEYDMEETFDYVMSMAFYFVLAKVEYNIDCDVILDVLGKSAPHQYVWYRLSKDRLLEKMSSKVLPWLDALIKAYETNTRLPIDPLTWRDVPRSEVMKSEYYAYLESWLQKSFLDPMW